MAEYINATISRIMPVTPNIRRFILRLDKDVNYNSGQFIRLSIEKNNDLYTRPYSIASFPGKDKRIIELCIKLVKEGIVTPYLFQQKIGDKLKIEGPFNHFQEKIITKNKLYFIAMGVGITPIRSIINDIIRNRHTKKQIVLIYGNRYERTILYRKEFEELEQRNSNFKFIKVISKPGRNWKGEVGYVQNYLNEIDIKNGEVFICGYKRMVGEIKNKLTEMGLESKFIH